MKEFFEPYIAPITHTYIAIEIKGLKMCILLPPTV